MRIEVHVNAASAGYKVGEVIWLDPDPDYPHSDEPQDHSGHQLGYGHDAFSGWFRVTSRTVLTRLPFYGQWWYSLKRWWVPRGSDTSTSS